MGVKEECSVIQGQGGYIVIAMKQDWVDYSAD